MLAKDWFAAVTKQLEGRGQYPMLECRVVGYAERSTELIRYGECSWRLDLFCVLWHQCYHHGRNVRLFKIMGEPADSARAKGSNRDQN